MPQYIDYDQALYGHNIIKALKPNTYPVFNPHHIHEEAGGVFFHRFMVNTLGKAGFTDVMFNNRLRSLLFACAGIFFAVLYLYNTTKKLLWALLGGILIGVCHGYIVFAVKVDTAIFPAAGMIITLWFLERIENARRFIFFYAAAGGLILFVDIMLHQFMGIACLAFCISLVLPPIFFPASEQRTFVTGEYKKGVCKSSTGMVITPFVVIPVEKKPVIDKKPKIRYVSVGIVTLLCCITTAAVYFYTGKSVYHLPFDKPSPIAVNGPFKNTTFQTWVFRYATFRGYGHGFRHFNPKKSFRGYTNAFLSPTVQQRKRFDALTFNYNLNNFFENKHFVYNQVALFSFIVIAGLIIFIPFMWVRYRRSFFFILLSLILFSLFITYWEPYHYEFWLIPCILICILSVQLFSLAGEKLAPVFRGFSHTPFYVYLLFFILCLFSFNSGRHIIPYSQTRRIEELYRPWTKEEFLILFSNEIYKYPGAPYKTLYPEYND
jgi:hypothetical protein